MGMSLECEMTNIKSRSSIISVSSFIFAGSIIILFIVLYKSPLRLDDLVWGSSLGIDRLHEWFADYNGRYCGNIVVIVLTRIPKILTVIIEIAILVFLFFNVYYLLNKNKAALFVFFCAFLVMPLVIFSQTISWISGFSNYVFSALFVLSIINIDLNIMKNNASFSIKNFLSIITITFLGQFFLENTTVYICLFSIGAFVLFLFIHKRISILLLIQIVTAALGAFIMFSNSAYSNAMSSSSNTYKSINIGGNIFDSIIYAMNEFKDSIVYYWFGINVVLNIALVIVLICFCVTNNNRSSKVLSLIGCAFLSIFVYDIVDGESFYFEYSFVQAIICVLFLLYVISVIIFSINDKNELLKFIALLVSLVVLMLPLIIAHPIFERCFFNTYIIWAIVFSEFFRLTVKEKNSFVSKNSSFCLACSVFVFVYLIFTLIGLLDSYEVEQARMDEIKRCKLNQSKVLILPNVNDASKYCYGANLESNYWYNNYKRYYNIDKNITVKFIDYDLYKSTKKRR